MNSPRERRDFALAVAILVFTLSASVLYGVAGVVHTDCPAWAGVVR